MRLEVEIELCSTILEKTVSGMDVYEAKIILEALSTLRGHGLLDRYSAKVSE
jgi:hypothetical protein